MFFRIILMRSIHKKVIVMSAIETMGRAAGHSLARLVEEHGDNVAAFLADQTLSQGRKMCSANLQSKLGLSCDFSFMDDYAFPISLIGRSALCDLAASCDHVINMPPNDTFKEAIEDAVIGITDEMDAENDVFVASMPK